MTKEESLEYSNPEFVYFIRNYYENREAANRQILNMTFAAFLTNENPMFFMSLTILDTTYYGNKTYSCDKEKGIYFIDGNKVTKEEYEKQTSEFMKYCTIENTKSFLER